MSICDILVQKINIIDYIGDIVELKRDGRIFRSICPLHKDTDPSFVVYPDTRSFYCFGCGKGGTIINFVQYHDNISYNQAIEKLADYANIDVRTDKAYLKQKSIFEMNDNAVRNFQRDVIKCTDYLIKNRGLTPEIVEEFKLGWNEQEKSIVIPIRDQFGRTIAFSRRFMQSEPKYKNSRNSDIYDKSKTLFNMDKARTMISDRLYVVEGYFDAISGHQLGFPTVAYCSSELTREHIMLIKEVVNNNPNITIMLVPDNDTTGHNKVIKMQEKIASIAPGLNVRVVELPEDVKDFNDLLVLKYDINNLPTEHIDKYTLKFLLSKCKSQEAEYIIAEEFCRKIKSQMILADIACDLSVKWNKKLDWVNNYLLVTKESDDSMLKEFRSVGDCLDDYYDIATSEGMGLGFSGIDYSIRGIRKQETVIVGAYSGVGKTWYAIEMTIHLAVRLKQNVLVFSLEMPSGGYMERIIANILGISTDELLAKTKESDQSWMEIYTTIKEKLMNKIRIIDKNNIDIKGIDTRIKMANARIWTEGQTDVVIVDYFQYIKGTNTYETASETARSMKEIAKENNLVFICLSQLNRSGKPWERPTMMTLKGTGDLEASADILILAWKPCEDPALTPSKKKELENVILVTIAKGRRGVRIRDFEHYFNPKVTRIREINRNYSE